MAWKRITPHALFATCLAVALALPTGQAAAETASPPGLLTLCLATLPETRPQDIWTAWSLSPAIVLPLVLVSLLYLRGFLAVRATGAASRTGSLRAGLFAAGIACLIVALVSPVCRLAAMLAWAHMIQHVLLVVGAPLLLAWGRPGRELLVGLPAFVRAMAGTARQVPEKPPPQHAYLFIAFVLYGANIWLWHIPALYEAALLTVGLHLLMYTALLIVSLLFWHAVLETFRTPGAASGTAALLLFFTFLHTGFLGILLTFSPKVWYPLIALRGAAWGLPPLDDQRLAGLIMWIPMGSVYCVVALALLARLIADSGRLSGGESVRAGML
ncbi:cytochrome c oxidase assembly protein [Microvirga massiliensis]|uniref:cytochrome c oxidase assembly protein n=1 Tax=Microvirga massiliensis TaxID=1033741 RepID=UPI00065FC923|nr:cytochrome c oxidase assembly protein [Microvirga massiliensis]